MSQETKDLLISISRRNTSISDVANDILDDTDVEQEFDPSVIELCKLLHMPPTNDLVKIAERVIPKLIHEHANPYEDYVSELKFDEDRAGEFYTHYMSTLAFKGVADSSIDYMFGVPRVFNKSNEENYGCAKALLELYGDRGGEAPTLWRHILLFKGRILDAD